MKKILISAFMLTFAVGAGADAAAAGIDGLTKIHRPAKAIREARQVVPPFAHVMFCANNPDECRDTPGPAQIELNSDNLRQLQTINRRINRSIHPQKDNRDSLAGDVWQIDASSGDCEDFALTKRSKLMRLGWSSRALRMATAITSDGEGHAVLVVKTRQGDFVLDNRFNTIMPVDKTDLHFVAIQSEYDPQQWHSTL